LGPSWILGVLTTALVVAALLAVASGCTAGPTVTRDNSFTIGESPFVIVHGENGSIEVTSGANNTVAVHATLRGSDRVKYSVEQDGDTITVDARIDHAWWPGNVGADILIAVPPKTDMDLENSNGAIELRDTEGSASLKTSNARIVMEEMKGDFDVRTSNGAIDVNHLEGYGLFKTSNAGVSLEGVTGEIDVETSNGRISYSGNMTAGGANRLVTSNGAVDVELLGVPSVSLSAQTSNAGVTCRWPITATETGDNHLVGVIGDGQADLDIRTSNASVTIR
jgi:DUF4097 and DUF4098 domain-containing protein YvlB